ncbi:hypothetical protein ACFVU3_19390 [Streptomyces sp. NPDC058052]|uniref:hypothetical protein n=1 Tax=Streptomyces sp. NPDC058052 TaxID=3346316 RepID=UPI0036E9E9E3
MERFVPRFQGRPWPSGMPVLHVYVLPRPGADDELLTLARSCVPLMAEYPIDPQLPGTGDDAGLLHLTVEMLADTPATDYDEPALRLLVEAMGAELADVAPFTTKVGPPLANIAGVVLDVWPEAEAEVVREATRTAIRKARGEAALQHSGGRLHISLGYADGTGSSDRLNSRLRNEVVPRRAPMYVDRVHLLAVTWTEDEGSGGWRMSWEPVAEVPLGGSPR